MELRYSFVLFIGIVVLGLLILFRFRKKKHVYKNGKRIANTKYVKKLPFYQEILKKYKVLVYMIEGLFIGAILVSVLLISRPVKVDKYQDNQYNRDIFLCMDVSYSVDKLNLQIVEALKETVSNLKGERFGISIFNTSSIVLVPLTDDYDYVLTVLDDITASLEAVTNFDTSSYYTYDYIVAGTIEGNEYYGSSLIGDGLVSCVNSFSDLEEDPDRTRIVIFSTDNVLAGKPVFTLEEAGEYSKNRNVLVYGIATKTITSKNKAEFKDAVELTGGTLYEEASGTTVKSIVKRIEDTSKNVIIGEERIVRMDMPQVPFILLMGCVFGLFVLTKRVAYYDN